MIKNKRLLREHIRAILLEDDGGDVAGDLMGGAVDAMPYGMSYGSGTDLYKVFVEPFVDVAKVAAGKTKELSVKAQTLGKTVLKGIVASIIPNVADDYERIFAEEHQKLEKIKREYQDVYDRVWAAFGHDDVKVLAFFYDPFAAGALLGYFGGKAAIETALDAVNVLSGGLLDNLLVRGRTKKPKKSPIEQGVGGDVDEGRLREVVDEKNDPKKIGAAVKKALASDKSKALQREAQTTVRSSLNAVVKRAQAMASAKSLQDLTKAGIDVPKDALAQLKKLSPEERGGLESSIVQASKKAAFEFYAKNLEGQVQHALKAGVPEKGAYVRDYERTIAKIRSLS